MEIVWLQKHLQKFLSKICCLAAEETKRLKKLQALADKLKRRENVQNRQLKTWLNEEEYEKLDYEWQEQLELRSELKDKPSDLKRYEEKLREATFMPTYLFMTLLKHSIKVVLI